MRGSHSFVVIVVFVFAAVLTGCMSPLREIKPSQELVVPERNPLHVDAAQMESVTFSRMLVDIPVGATLGRVVRDGKVVNEIKAKEADLSAGAPRWNRMALDEMRQAGYPVLGAENLLFNQDESGKSRYVIGGTVKDLVLVVHDSTMQWRDSETPLECGTLVTWQAFDTNTRQVVLTRQVRGYASMPGLSQVIGGSIRSSFRGILADADFVNTLRRRGTADAALNTPAPATTKPAVQIKSPAVGELQLPQQMQKVTDAVCTVRVGMVHGSGFLIAANGYIVTAAHVVSGRDTCLVKLSNGRDYEARVLRLDDAYDVALLRIAEDNHPALRLARGAPPTVGSEVYAIGTPLMEQLERSVSKGIVSGVRSNDGRDLIQTDAAVNFGNSGGPLIDKTGAVIGVLSLKVGLPGYEGIGFAVPTDVVIRRLGLDIQ